MTPAKFTRGQGAHSRASPLNERPLPLHGRVTLLKWTLHHDTPAFHRCHADGFCQDRLLHAYTTPTIFNCVVSRVSQRICILRLVKSVFVDTSVLLRCCYELLSQSSSIVLRCRGQLLTFTFSFLIARCVRWPGFRDQSFLSVCC